MDQQGSHGFIHFDEVNATHALQNSAMATTSSPAPVTRADREAAEAAQVAGVSIRPLADRDECHSAAVLLANLWGTEIHSAPLNSDVLVSLRHAGACLLGAFDPQAGLVGVVVGLAGEPCSAQLYSMIAGVAPDWAGRGVGVALKLAERTWALQSQAHTMIWTFDPLIRRNASFNLIRLGAKATEYMEDFYPPMHDAINVSDRPDRLVVEWDLHAFMPSAPPSRSGTVVLSCNQSGEPVRHGLPSGDWLVQTPPDIERARLQAPEVAAQWRLEMRDVMRAGYDDGRAILGFTRDAYYVIGKPE